MFGTGGETVKGQLGVTHSPLFKNGDLSNAFLRDSSPKSGYVALAVLVDVTGMVFPGLKGFELIEQENLNEEIDTISICSVAHGFFVRHR